MALLARRAGRLTAMASQIATEGRRAKAYPVNVTGAAALLVASDIEREFGAGASSSTTRASCCRRR